MINMPGAAGQVRTGVYPHDVGLAKLVRSTIKRRTSAAPIV